MIENATDLRGAQSVTKSWYPCELVHIAALRGTLISRERATKRPKAAEPYGAARRFTVLRKVTIVFARQGHERMAQSAHGILQSAASSCERLSGEPLPHSSTTLSPRSFINPATAFSFLGRVQGIDYPSLSPAQQHQFRADVHAELDILKNWCALKDWVPMAFPAELRIFVSDEYKNSKSLLPAAVGQHGRMEFPAWKVVAGEAPIIHELVHVYFPNGNRFVAEMLAIYLQAALGRNPAFPNFGRPLHQMACDLLPKMLPELSRADAASLEKIRLIGLDKIATPSSLRMRVGLNLYQDDPSGQAHIYSLVGSFAQFLLETQGIDRFRALYALTPLKPFEREAGSPDRWRDIYGTSLGKLEMEWKKDLCVRAGFRSPFLG
jgi:hypothetical protein